MNYIYRAMELCKLHPKSALVAQLQIHLKSMRIFKAIKH